MNKSNQSNMKVNKISPCKPKEERTEERINSWRWLFFSVILIASLLYSKQSTAQTKEGFCQMVKAYGIQYAEIVTAQAVLETGGFKCSNCSLDKNNYFGFHNGERYLVYDNAEHCIENMKLWQDWRCPNCETEKEYYDCLVKYWGAPNMKKYVEKVKAIY